MGKVGVLTFVSLSSLGTDGVHIGGFDLSKHP